MTSHPEVKSEIMIRRPANEIFEYFVDPKKLAEFWLSHSSARLELGKTIQWKFKIKGAEDTIHVTALEPGRLIKIEWGGGVEVSWIFKARSAKETMVSIIVSNIKGSRDEQFTYAVDVSQGFMITLLELKALLEKEVVLNAIYDKYPDSDHL
ncbi:MAG: polyketide cyclase [Proteobacteria bacterium]|nr:MAG: polyketide cyclase [Pseudomonadota bacterium]